jgi:hypothetical protein
VHACGQESREASPQAPSRFQNKPRRCNEDLRTSTLPPARQQLKNSATPRPPAEQYDISDNSGDDDDEETRNDHERTGPAYDYQRPENPPKMIDTLAQIGRRGGRRADGDAHWHEDDEGNDDENALTTYLRLQNARALPEHDVMNTSSGGSTRNPGDDSDDDEYVFQRTLPDHEERDNLDIIVRLRLDQVANDALCVYHATESRDSSVPWAKESHSAVHQVRLGRKEIDEDKFSKDETDYAEIQGRRQENTVRFPKFKHTEMHFIELTPGKAKRDDVGMDDDGEDDGQFNDDRAGTTYAYRPNPNPKVIGSITQDNTPTISASSEAQNDGGCPPRRLDSCDGGETGPRDGDGSDDSFDDDRQIAFITHVSCTFRRELCAKEMRSCTLDPRHNQLHGWLACANLRFACYVSALPPKHCTSLHAVRTRCDRGQRSRTPCSGQQHHEPRQRR